MNAESARAILVEARNSDIYEGQIPDDAEKVITQANAIVEMAQQAWDQHIRGPEVEGILRLAAERHEVEETPPLPNEPVEVIEREPLVELPEQEVVHTNGETKSFPEPPDALKAPEPEAQPLPSQEGDDEPWPNYDKDKLAEIYEAVDALAAEGDVNTLRYVLSYEQPRKNRMRVVNRVNDAINKVTGVPREEVPTEEVATPEAPREAASTPEPDDGGEQGEPGDAPEAPEVEPETGYSGSEGDGAGTLPSDAPDVPAQEAPESSGEDRDGEDAPEPPAEARGESGAGSGDQGGRPEVPESQVEDDGNYDKLLAEATADVERERMVVPKPPTQRVPEIPEDWSKISDSELRNLYMTYSSLAFYKDYILAVAMRKATLCKQAVEELSNELMTTLPKHDENGKAKTIALLEAEIYSDENVCRWRRRQTSFEMQVTSAKNEKDSFHKIVESMSRLATMRAEEHERTRRI